MGYPIAIGFEMITQSTQGTLRIYAKSSAYPIAIGSAASARNYPCLFSKIPATAMKAIT
jgi:hypothetical protein